MSGLLPAVIALTGLPAGAAESPTLPPPQSASTHQARPRDRFVAGARWRVRTSQLPVQQPVPDWTHPETWDFVVLGIQPTPDGSRLIVTATREGASKPTVWLQLDPQTQAVLRADTLLPSASGERYFTERPTPAEPFVSQASPVPIALPAPPGAEKIKSNAEDAATSSQPSTDSHDAASAAGSPSTTDQDDSTPAGSSAPAANSHPSFSFSFGPRFHQQTGPLDAGVGRDMIERGMAPLKLRRDARLEPAGIPRFLTQIEGPGAHIKQVWDDTTPWPLYSETETSRTWLVSYQKEK